MDETLQTELVVMAKHMVVNVLTSVLLAGVLGFDWGLFAELWVAFGLNVFIIPVAVLTPHFNFPLWVWYVAALTWVGVFGDYFRHVHGWGSETTTGGDDEEEWAY